ncbi:radical SAM protein [Chitinispirillales bacterium ANBcel5]|uniref:radical SAM protein n=1 Tax=Cellulosispirillum alkaliphilum TaxID=3039283 RepID=UPI002A4FA962|nr:radical SAM protein [Chitinispirillales bacterium ANBcel5]
MALDISRHPCFNMSMRHKYGRLHLPVAPSCNIQCRFCNRKYDCVNESRPGVTSAVLKPWQALFYLEKTLAIQPDISVVGIAGPGDPFACPQETLSTLQMVRDHFPEMLLCVASNGMNVSPYVQDLAALNVSHVTITVNTIDSEIGSKVYRWMRYSTKVMRGEEGASKLIEQQLAAIKKLKENGITVKVNTIVIPGINDNHIEDLASCMKDYGVDILNCMPLYPAPGSEFENVKEPSTVTMADIRKKAKAFIPQMTHCARCRADAVGKIGERNREEINQLLKGCCTGLKRDSEKSNVNSIAVASMEGLLVNQHLGNALEVSVFRKSDDGPTLVERRKTPPPGKGDDRWHELARILHDCHTLCVQYAGKRPIEILAQHGIEVILMEGLIETALNELFNGRCVPVYMTQKVPRSCGSGCGGSGGGCAG